MQENATTGSRPARKFTPANIQKIKDWVAEGISREEIAKTLRVTVGSLQVTCSRLGISLRRRDLSGPPPIAGQRHTGTGFQISLILECNGTRGQLLAEVVDMAIKKGMIEEILHKPTQERAAPLQRENA